MSVDDKLISECRKVSGLNLVFEDSGPEVFKVTRLLPETGFKILKDWVSELGMRQYFSFATTKMRQRNIASVNRKSKKYVTVSVS